MTNHGNCRYCEAAIVWSTTTNGVPIPLNPIPVRVAFVIQGTVDLKEALMPHINTCTKKPASRRTRG